MEKNMEVQEQTGNRMEHNDYVQNGVGRLIFVAIAIIVEAIALFCVFRIDNRFADLIPIAARIAALLLVLVICNQDRTASVKILWVLLIMAFPLLGVILYLLIGNSGSTKKMRLRFAVVDTKLYPKMPQNHDVLEELQREDPMLGNVSSYLKSCASFPVYENTDVTYFSDAAQGLRSQIEQMEQAKKFIFMEYHAIEDAQSFHQIEEVLARKSREGVDVRIIYDDMGSIGFINVDFINRMKQVGIACRVFNPFVPVMRLVFNNRDHRKITVIDGEVGYTGGYNIADEYFNLTHPYGYWKDTGVMLRGDAVRSLTVMFLEMWNAVRDDNVDERDVQKFVPQIEYEAAEKGFVQPYADTPLDDEHVGENVYISLIEAAHDYVWFTTPYLILTDEMVHALGIAAKRGVDVRIITPGIPDKKLIYRLTRSYYSSLAKCGVRIYEYTPGFLHAKMCIMDGRAAVCGTINLDYRSLYHHFENGCLFTTQSALSDMKKDFDNIMTESREVTEEYRSGLSSLRIGTDLVLRLFSPLL